MIDKRDERKEAKGTAWWILAIAIVGMIALGIWWMTTHDRGPAGPDGDMPAPDTRDTPPPDIDASVPPGVAYAFLALAE